jgi:hypothetical protein
MHMWTSEGATGVLACFGWVLSVVHVIVHVQYAL